MGKPNDGKLTRRARQALERMIQARNDMNASITLLQAQGWETLITTDRKYNPVLRRGYDHVSVSIIPVPDEARTREMI